MEAGMNLNRFHAIYENEKLKKELENLNGKISELTKERDQYKEYCEALSDKCFAQTDGCLFCDVKICKYALDGEDWNKIYDFIKEHHLRWDNVVYTEVGEFIKKLQRQKQMIQLARNIDEFSNKIIEIIKTR